METGKRSFIALYVCLFCLSKLWAQEALLYGTVQDSASLEPLIGATVQTQDGKGVFTDINGKFQLSLPPGVYTLEIKYIGYKTIVFSQLELKAGVSQPLSIMMAPAAIGLGEVVVIAYADKFTVNALISQQKNSLNIGDGISLETISRTPDRNLSQAIKRVSGVSVQDGRFAVIRGLADRYNAAMLNNLPLPSSEADRKVFAFDIFPTALLDNLVVIKTATPNLPGEFAGGAIQIQTRSVQDKPFLEWSLGASFNTLTTFRSHNSYAGGKLDFLGLDDGTRALPSGIPASEILLKADRAARIEYAKQIPNRWALQEGNIAFPGLSFQITGGKRYALGPKHYLGTIAAFTYSLQNNIQPRQRADYDTDGKMNDYQDIQFSQQTLLGGLLNLTLDWGERNQIRWNHLLTIRGQDQTITRTGVILKGAGALRKNYGYIFQSTPMYSTQLSGEHAFASSSIKLIWNAGLSHIAVNIPNYRNLLYVKAPNAPDSVPYRAEISTNVDLDQGGMFFSHLRETQYNGSFAFHLPYSLAGKAQSVQAGVSCQQKQRTFSARVLGYVLARTSSFNFNLLYLRPQEIFKPENFGDTGFALRENTNLQDKYDANALLQGYYLMNVNAITPNLKAIWGLRLEVFNQRLNSFDKTDSPVRVDTVYQDWLPSLNLIQSISQKSNLRFALSRAVSRPEFRELAPFAFYDFTTNFVVLGNPALFRTRIWNFDLRYEHYPSASEIITFSLFYKRFYDPIEQVVQLGTGAGSTNLTFTNINASADNMGFEIELRKDFSFLAPLLGWENSKYLTASFNYAFIHSRIDVSEAAGAIQGIRPLQGQSPYIFNGSLQYSFSKINASLATFINQVGRRIAQVGTQEYPHIWENPRWVWDLQIAKKINQRWDLKLTISDLLAQDLIFYQDMDNFQPTKQIYHNRHGDGNFKAGVDNVIQRLKFGQTFSLTISAKW
jgi:hypothetical protein